MPRGFHLSEKEKGQIEAFKSIGLSERCIAKKFNRSKTAIHQFVSKSADFKTKKRSGRPPKLSKTNILRLASNSTIPTQQIRDTMELPVHRKLFFESSPTRILLSTPECVLLRL